MTSPGGPEFALVRYLQAFGDPAGMEKDAQLAGVLVTNEIRVQLSQPGRGRVYRSRMRNVGGKRTYVRGGKGHLHQASAPGDPPAVDTGALRASYTFSTSRGRLAVSLLVFTPDPVGGWLELGTRRILPRPHVRPAVMLTAPLVARTMAAGAEARGRAQARRDGGRA